VDIVNAEHVLKWQMIQRLGHSEKQLAVLPPSDRSVTATAAK